MERDLSMIVRFFRVRVFADLREEFEQKFETISVGAVKDAAGLQSVKIYRPT